MISKIKVLDVLSICLIRHEAEDCKCKDCTFYGPECIEAHRYAEGAVRSLKVKEVNNAKQV